jgi:arsenical pump membrane protein
MKLFITLYVVVSILTVFTSNDIIVLTFTPFICYFAKNAKINPFPYLVSEFVAANTMSMTLIIGNPTNIYIATAYGVNFLEYAKVMLIPTLASSIVAFLFLFLLFRRLLKKPAEANIEDVKIENKPFLIIGLIHLSVCTVILAIGPYIGIDMWLVSFLSALSLFICILITSAFKKQKPTPNCFKNSWGLMLCSTH